MFRFTDVLQPLILPSKGFGLRFTGFVRTFKFALLEMGGEFVTIEIVFVPEWFLVRAVWLRAYQGLRVYVL
jgi:hypothetical protein